mgnify:CR=1 FL=1
MSLVSLSLDGDSGTTGAQPEPPLPSPEAHGRITGSMPTDNPENVIEVENLYSHYGERAILQDINLVIRAGEIMVIMGGSAGGYTVLKCLVDYPGFFRAALCLYGVSNMFTLAADTHKFEERYLDSMLGPLPEASAIYRERSPIFNIDRIVDPIAVFQGEIDRVVPKAQAEAIVESLRRRGVPHEYHLYEGEGHGWRKQETIEAFYQTVESFLRQYVIFS